MRTPTKRERRQPTSVVPEPNLGMSAMLTKDFLFGLNILSLAGFLVMGLGVNLNRTGRIGVPLSVGLMCAGTALVFYGLYARGEGG